MAGSVERLSLSAWREIPRDNTVPKSKGLAVDFFDGGFRILFSTGAVIPMSSPIYLH